MRILPQCAIFFRSLAGAQKGHARAGKQGVSTRAAEVGLLTAHGGGYYGVRRGFSARSSSNTGWTPERIDVMINNAGPNSGTPETEFVFLREHIPTAA